MVFQHGRSHGLCGPPPPAKIAQGAQARVLARLLSSRSRWRDDVRHSLASTFKKPVPKLGSRVRGGRLDCYAPLGPVPVSAIPGSAGRRFHGSDGQIRSPRRLRIGGRRTCPAPYIGGVGHLTVSDPDRLSEENLYRHTLSLNHIGRLKTEALAHAIAHKHCLGRSDTLE